MDLDQVVVCYDRVLIGCSITTSCSCSLAAAGVLVVGNKERSVPTELLPTVYRSVHGLRPLSSMLSCLHWFFIDAELVGSKNETSILIEFLP